MNWKVNELLSILNQPEDVQKIFLAVGGVLGTTADEKTGAAYLTKSLAETAFRMRDEVEETSYFKMAIIKVHEHVDYGGDRMYAPNLPRALSWFCFQSKPIHWIIAALIAEVRKEEEVV